MAAIIILTMGVFAFGFHGVPFADRGVAGN